MSTVITRLTPTDHGRPMDWEEFSTAPWEEGYKYELIEGRVYVSPVPNLTEDFIEEWLIDKLKAYSREHPEAINYVTPKGRIFVPGLGRISAPEPDITAFHAFPTHLPLRSMDWRKVSPVLVVEVISAADPDKDLIRNVTLYLQAPSIQEYWILDTREDPEQPLLRVHRRRDSNWVVQEFSYGDTYTTKLLPGFKLLIDPRK